MSYRTTEGVKMTGLQERVVWGLDDVRFIVYPIARDATWDGIEFRLQGVTAKVAAQEILDAVSSDPPADLNDRLNRVVAGHRLMKAWCSPACPDERFDILMGRTVK